jgi:NADH:ubiquinone oxidoreductase subunit 5 (subunit L)/multisubunit Na+/H+ antiporter MnhA subunit
MKHDKAPGYWPARILLAVAIIATAIVVALALWSAFWAPPTFGGSSPSEWELPNNVVLVVLAAAIAVLGLIWTIRIFRGPRGEPPPWRYRDR